MAALGTGEAARLAASAASGSELAGGEHGWRDSQTSWAGQGKPAAPADHAPWTAEDRCSHATESTAQHRLQGTFSDARRPMVLSANVDRYVQPIVTCLPGNAQSDVSGHTSGAGALVRGAWSSGCDSFGQRGTVYLAAKPGRPVSTQRVADQAWS